MVFISYKGGEGTPFATRIAKHLDSCGIPCFYFERDCKTPEAVSKYWDDIVVPIVKETATSVILVLTSGTLKKDLTSVIDYVREEIRLLEEYKPEIYINRLAVVWDNGSIDKDKPAIPAWVDRLKGGRQIIFTIDGVDKALAELYGRIGAWEGYDGQEYFTAENGVLKKFKGGVSSIKIPAVFSEIADSAFYGDTEIHEVFLESTSIVRIGQSAFKKCTGLKKVKLPPTVQKVGMYAFKDAPCATLNGGMVTVSDTVLIDCRAAGDVILPDSVICIADGAFWCNRDITSVRGNGVKFIGEDAFKDCTKLQTKTFPLLDNNK